MPPFHASFEPIRVLLIHDDLIGALHLRLAIEMSPIPCVVDGVENSVMALRSLCRSIRAGSRPPDMGIFECDLRESASQAILRLALKSPELSSARWIVLGDGDDPEQEARASELGAGGFIAKPVRASDLPRIGRDLGRIWNENVAAAG